MALARGLDTSWTGGVSSLENSLLTSGILL
jgi:hypothetical protein